MTWYLLSTVFTGRAFLYWHFKIDTKTKKDALYAGLYLVTFSGHSIVD
jgi:hypothetical protein